MLPRIALAGVNVRLGGRHVLHDIGWSLGEGQHWAIVGANGSGKSTLLRTIAALGWIEADGGTRRFSADGVTLDATARARTWIRHVSAEQHERYARLDLGLCGRDVVESGFTDGLYVERTSASRRAASESLIERLGLREIALRAVRELSSGQLRRLLIARALVGNPRVLVLDECTNGLDGAARHDVITLLDRIAPHVALIIASHRLSDFPAAITHCAQLVEGRIARTQRGGPAADLLATEPPRQGSSTPASGAGTLLIDIRNADVYRGERLVLAGIDWQLRRGEHTIVRGANGAGKSTFAGLIAGTISAATGADIVRFGRRGPFDIRMLKQRIAHVSDDLQIAYTWSDSVEDVVASGYASSIGLIARPSAVQRQAVDRLLGDLRLDGLRTRDFTTLSYGERRKILIARSIVREPDIFLLDEVWNGLDSAFRKLLLELLTRLAGRGTTIVTIAHEATDDLPFARRAYTLAAGKLSEERLEAGV